MRYYIYKLLQNSKKLFKKENALLRYCEKHGNKKVYK